MAALIDLNMNKSTIAKLDKVFSEYVRLRDSDSNGYGKCITCGKVIHWKDGDAGHAINRAHMSTRYDETNVHLQCRHCNRFREGEIVEYSMALIKRYGQAKVDVLLAKKHFTSKMGDFEGKQLIKLYQAKVSELKSKKSL